MEAIDESPVEVWSAGFRGVAARLPDRCPKGLLRSSARSLVNA